MSFRDVLSEMSIAGYGNWKPNKAMIGVKSAIPVKTEWSNVGTIRDKSNSIYDVYRLHDEFIVGVFKKTSTNDEIFEIVFKIELTERKDILTEFKIHRRLMNVDGVFVKDTKRGDGIATAMYKFLVKNTGMYILGDETQYFGARRLWSRLSKHIDVTVDIIDIDASEIVESNVILHHGSEDWDFDTRVWSYNHDKKDIRLVLKNIKE